MWDNFLQNPMNLEMLKLSAPQMMPGAPTTTVPPQPSMGKGFDPAMFSMMARYGRPNTQSAQPMMSPQQMPAQMPTAPAPTGFAQSSPFSPPAPVAAAPAAAMPNGQMPVTLENIKKYGLAGVFNPNGSMG